MKSLVNNVEGKATQKVDLCFEYPKIYNSKKDTIATALACHGVNIDSHATELQLTEKNFAYNLNNKPLDFDKIATIRFIVPCSYFENGDSLFVTNNKGLDIAIQHRKNCRNYSGRTDRIVCLLPDLEDNYAWFAKAKNASRPTNEAIFPIEFDNNRYAEIHPNIPPVANAIDNVNASPSNVTVVRRYTMDGRSISMPQRGVNLLQMSDGTIRKVIVK